MIRPCSCGSGLIPREVYDAQRIYLCKVCPRCERERLAGYRPEILRGYDQNDVNEPIEPEDV